MPAWLALSVGISMVASAMSAPATGSASSVPSSKQVEEQQKAVAALQITEIAFHKEGYNNITMLNATVQNTGKRDVKDIKVVCDQPAKGQTSSDAIAATIYGPFPAGKAKSIHEVDVGVYHDQAQATNCSIVHATLATKRWGRAAK
jgi:hypothetical protein